jgi:hypothetical protein
LPHRRTLASRCQLRTALHPQKNSAIKHLGSSELVAVQAHTRGERSIIHYRQRTCSLSCVLDRNSSRTLPKGDFASSLEFLDSFIFVLDSSEILRWTPDCTIVKPFGALRRHSRPNTIPFTVLYKPGDPCLQHEHINLGTGILGILLEHYHIAVCDHVSTDKSPAQTAAYTSRSRNHRRPTLRAKSHSSEVRQRRANLKQEYTAYI